jgi:hypothetical protein
MNVGPIRAGRKLISCSRAKRPNGWRLEQLQNQPLGGPRCFVICKKNSENSRPIPDDHITVLPRCWPHLIWVWEFDEHAARGVIVRREAIRLWVNRFGRYFADCIRQDRPPRPKPHTATSGLMRSTSGAITPPQWLYDPAFSKLHKPRPTTWQYRLTCFGRIIIL